MTHRQRQARRRRHKARPRNWILLGAALVASAGLIGALSVVGYILAVAATAPNVDDLKPIDKGASSEIFAADGRRLGYVQSNTIRTPIAWADMPVDLRNATVAIEDQRFYHHGGVDYESIVRAALRDVTSGKKLQGGSTITQQLVRNLYIRTPKRDLKRKIREAKMASELEKSHTKQWILEQYLNDVPYGTVNGNTALGAEAAAQTYFGKHAKELTLDQAAMIAGLPQAPSIYNPFTNPGGALARRNAVLERMYTNHYISLQQEQQAQQAPLKLSPGTLYTKRHEPYFFDFVQDQLIQRYGVNVFRQGGLKVYTTIEPELQTAARNAIEGQLNLPTDPSSAIVTIDPSNGHVLAMASSGTYKNSKFNLAAQGHRQPGSAFKTFVLATAIKQGVNPNSTYYNSHPLDINLDGTPWMVHTFGNDYLGRVNLVQATLHSDNTVYAQLDLDLGPKNVAETAKEMGITTHLDGYPAEGLGGLRLGVSPLEMADAYATLAAGGVHHKPVAITRVVFPDGKSDRLGRNPGNRVLTDGEAYEVTKILHQNVLGGTGVRANIGCPAAGKTGTTSDFNDAWFVGFTPKLATATWVGYPNALVSMLNVHGAGPMQGGSFPAMIWHDYMNIAKGSFCGDFPLPTTPVHWTPFYGHYTTTGATGPTGPVGPTGPKTNGGAAPNKGYDPRLYSAPPQKSPKTPSSKPKQPSSGGGGGNGAGGGSPADPTG